MLKKLHYWLAFVAPRPLNKLAPLVDRLMAAIERARTWPTRRD